MPGQPEFQQRLKSIEQLLGKVEAADPELRATVVELVRLVMDLHGAGLERILELIHAAGGEDESMIRKLGHDELVASLLVLHGLHPLDIETRVTQALDKARSRMRADEGGAELVSIADGTVRLRLRTNGHGCGSAQALKEMVEEAVYQAAPDVTTLIVEGAEEKEGFVPLEMLRASAPVFSVADGKGGR